MNPRILTGAALVLILLAASTAIQAAKNDDLKLKLSAKSAKTDPGDATELKLKLKNRADATRDITVQLFSEDDLVTPFAVETYNVQAGETLKVRVPFTVPEDHFGKKIRVYARSEGLEDDAKVKTRLGELTQAQWTRGRDLYQDLCGRCHGSKGGEVRGDSLDKWIRDMRNGPGSMPKYDTPVADIILMREYTRDANRF